MSLPLGPSDAQFSWHSLVWSSDFAFGGCGVRVMFLECHPGLLWSYSEIPSIPSDIPDMIIWQRAFVFTVKRLEFGKPL